MDFKLFHFISYSPDLVLRVTSIRKGSTNWSSVGWVVYGLRTFQTTLPYNMSNIYEYDARWIKRLNNRISVFLTAKRKQAVLSIFKKLIEKRHFIHLALRRCQRSAGPSIQIDVTNQSNSKFTPFDNTKSSCLLDRCKWKEFITAISSQSLTFVS